MSTIESAEHSMQQVVRALAESELARLEQFASPERMIAALEAFPRREWFETYETLMRKWTEGDEELRDVAERNRVALKLKSPNKSLNGKVVKAKPR